jgi:hypothetical protein
VIHYAHVDRYDDAQLFALAEAEIRASAINPIAFHASANRRQQTGGFFVLAAIKL